MLFTVIILTYLVGRKFLPLIRNIYNIKISERVSYKEEIFPYQWKIALSWISGFFIFQLFNPVIFATEGAIIAGQMGMTLAILSAIQSLSMSWMSTKVPLFSNLIALKKYNTLAIGIYKWTFIDKCVYSNNFNPILSYYYRGYVFWKSFFRLFTNGFNDDTSFS
jgi:hypothetical protein